MRSAQLAPIPDWSAYGWEPEAEGAPPAPSPMAISRMDETLPWLYWIHNPKVRKVVCLRAMGLSWRRAGRSVGVSHEHARTLERGGIEAIRRRLNDPAALPHSGRPTGRSAARSIAGLGAE